MKLETTSPQRIGGRWPNTRTVICCPSIILRVNYTDGKTSRGSIVGVQDGRRCGLTQVQTTGGSTLHSHGSLTTAAQFVHEQSSTREVQLPEIKIIPTLYSVMLVVKISPIIISLIIFPRVSCSASCDGNKT